MLDKELLEKLYLQAKSDNVDINNFVILINNNYDPDKILLKRLLEIYVNKPFYKINELNQLLLVFNKLIDNNLYNITDKIYMDLALKIKIFDIIEKLVEKGAYVSGNIEIDVVKSYDKKIVKEDLTFFDSLILESTDDYILQLLNRTGKEILTQKSLCLAFKSGKKKSINKLLELGADLNVTYNDKYPAEYWTSNFDTEILKLLHKFDFNKDLKSGETFLTFMIKSQKLDIKNLKGFNVDFNKPNSKGELPMLLYLENHPLDFNISDFGVNCNLKDVNGNNLYDLIIKRNLDFKPESPQISLQSFDILIDNKEKLKLFLDSGLTNQQINDKTFLEHAIETKSEDIAIELLNAWGNKNLTTQTLYLSIKRNYNNLTNKMLQYLNLDNNILNAFKLLLNK